MFFLIVYQFSFVHDYLLGGFLTIQHHPTLVSLIGFWRTNFSKKILGKHPRKSRKAGIQHRNKRIVQWLATTFPFGLNYGDPNVLI